MHTNKIMTGLGMALGIVLAFIAMTAAIPETHAVYCGGAPCSGTPQPDRYDPSLPVTCGPCCQVCHNYCISPKDICILEPFPGGPFHLSPSVAPFENFKQYVNNGVWQFMFKIGAAIAVLNGVIGGLQIVFSNGDSGAIEKGRHRLLWSMAGLIMLVMAGVIMTFINPIAFQ
jgi:hypothetical protein